MTVQVKNEVKGHDMCKFVRPPRFGLKVGWGFQTIFFGTGDFSALKYADSEYHIHFWVYPPKPPPARGLKISKSYGNPKNQNV